MDSAKEIATDMLAVMNLDKSGIVVSYIKGFIRLPVSLAYLSYDYIDTDSRSRRFDDKIRFAELIKQGVFRKELITRTVQVFINEFIKRMDRVDALKSVANISSSVLGGFSFSLVTGISLGEMIASSTAGALLAGGAIAGVLFIGAEHSRAIYVSRALRDTNPDIWRRLKSAGDLDLLYFIVQDIVAPYQRACEVADTDPEKFFQICDYFMRGYEN